MVFIYGGMKERWRGNYNITLPKDHPAVRVPPDYEHGFAFRTRQRSSYDHFVLP